MIKLIDASYDLDEFSALVKEYTDNIIRQDANVAGTLSSQNLDDELKDIEKKYGYPSGRMYILTVDGEVAGCVGLTKNDSVYCELKRLYVREKYRGQNLGKILCDRVIEDAKAIGYKYMRLDTFPFMTSAIKLYEKCGFQYTEKYNDNPAQNAIFMELKLNE